MRHSRGRGCRSSEGLHEISGRMSTESIEGYLQSLKLVYGMLSPVCAQSSSGCQPSEMSLLTSLGERVSTSGSHRMGRAAYLGQSADPISVSVLYTKSMKFCCVMGQPLGAHAQSPTMEA